MATKNICGRWVLSYVFLITCIWSINGQIISGYELRKWNSYYDSIYNLTNEDDESGEISLFKKTYNHWTIRINNNTDILSYWKSTKLAREYYLYSGAEASLKNTVSTWEEIGPKNTPDSCLSSNNNIWLDGCYARGTGPIERIERSENNPYKLLSCSLGGGVFLSVDGGLNWYSTGSDYLLPWSGIKSVIFDKNNDNIWYALSSFDANPFNWYENYVFEGGIYRSMDNGVTWQKIVDKNTFTGNNLPCWSYNYTSLYDIKHNGSKLFVATSCGLFYTTNSTSLNPV
jgi:hypothetical protein